LAHILRAFAKGADGVFIGGCRLGECNYITHGNYHALNLALLGKKILEHIGLNPRRLHIAFMSGGEGNLFASVVDDFCKTIKELGPIGQSEEITPARLEDAVTDIIRLVPYIKIEKHDKLTVCLEDETAYDDHFSLDEIKRLFAEVASYHIDPAKCQACMICARSCPVEHRRGKGGGPCHRSGQVHQVRHLPECLPLPVRCGHQNCRRPGAAATAAGPANHCTQGRERKNHFD